MDPRYGLDAVGKEVNVVVCFLLGMEELGIDLFFP